MLEMEYKALHTAAQELEPSGRETSMSEENH